MNSDWTPTIKPTSHETFDQMMLEIDLHLNSLDLHIHQRPMHAISLVICAFATEPVNIFEQPSPDTEAYSVVDLMFRARQWYASRFGDEIKVLPTIGFFLLPLNHRVWKVRAPYVIGELILTCSRQLQVAQKRNVISHGPIVVNMIDCFEGMTQAYATSLTDKEVEEIKSGFIAGCDALILLDGLAQGEDLLFKQARTDYNHSVEALMSFDRSYGKSRRDTATTAEKVMKGLLSARNLMFNKNHNLRALAGSLREQAGFTIDMALVDRIHTNADVSYGSVVTKSEAMDAHIALILFLSSLLPQVFVQRH